MNFIKNISNNSVADKELVETYKATGKMDVLSSLYQRYMELVYGVCLKYFKDAERSRDAVMDIFEELTVKLKAHNVENFKGWLHVLTKNHCLMQLRSPKNRKVVEFNTEFMQSEQELHLNGEESEQVQKEGQLTIMQGCIETLPEEQKQAVELFYLQEKCYNEIAAITGFEWNKVRSYIQNGRRNLKLCMEEKLKQGAKI